LSRASVFPIGRSMSAGESEFEISVDFVLAMACDRLCRRSNQKRTTSSTLAPLIAVVLAAIDWMA